MYIIAFVMNEMESQYLRVTQMVSSKTQMDSEANNFVIHEIISTLQRPHLHQKNKYHSENYHEDYSLIL